MAELLISTTGPEGFRRLGVHGQAVVEMHRQIVTILGNRLGRQHARFFARPQISPSDRRIDWYGPEGAAVQRLSDLPADRQARLKTLAAQITAEITQLAQRLKAEGASAELVGHMLELALVTPAGTPAGTGNLYVIGEQPVLILWGHEVEGVATAADAVAPSARPVSAATAQSVAPPAGQGAPPRAGQAGESAAYSKPGTGNGGDTAEAAALGAASASASSARRGWVGWLAWLLPLLLLALLIVLSFKACTPLPPVVVEVPEAAPPAAPPPENPLATLESREKELRERLAGLDRQQAESLALCLPPEPPPRAEAPKIPDPLPDPLPEPPVIGALEAPPVPVVPTKPEVPKPVPEALPPLASLIPPMPDEKTPPPPRPSAPPQQASPSAPPSAPSAPRAGGSCNPSYRPGEEPEVMVIVDGSGSMNESFLGQSRIGLARRSIAHIARTLPAPVSIGLIDFTDCTSVVPHKFYEAPERGELVRKVEALTPNGGTPLARSIERAGNLVSGQAPATIIVVSDGEDTCRGDPCAAARAVKAAKPNVVINVIDISGERGRPVIQCIANATGGRVLSPQSGADMLNKMQQATRLPDTKACKP